MEEREYYVELQSVCDETVCQQTVNDFSGHKKS